MVLVAGAIPLPANALSSLAAYEGREICIIYLPSWGNGSAAVSLSASIVEELVKIYNGTYPPVFPATGSGRVYYNGRVHVYRENTTYNNATLDFIVTSSYIVWFRLIGNTSYPWAMLGENFSDALREAIASVSPPGFADKIRVVYRGIYASKIVLAGSYSEAIGIAEEHNWDAYIVEGDDGYSVYVHPYEKYYVYIGWMKIIYPVIVRGAPVNETGGWPFRSLLGAFPIPANNTAAACMTMTRDYIEYLATVYSYYMSRLNITEPGETLGPDSIMLKAAVYAPWGDEEPRYTPLLIMSHSASGDIVGFITIDKGYVARLLAAAVLAGSDSEKLAEQNIDTASLLTEKHPSNETGEEPGYNHTWVEDWEKLLTDTATGNETSGEGETNTATGTGNETTGEASGTGNTTASPGTNTAAGGGELASNNIGAGDNTGNGGTTNTTETGEATGETRGSTSTSEEAGGETPPLLLAAAATLVLVATAAIIVFKHK